VTGVVGLEIVVAIVAVAVPVVENIKLAARNDLPLQRTEFVLAHFVVTEMHFIVVDSSSVSRSERTLLPVVIATITIVGNIIGNVLLDGDRSCHQIHPVLWGKHVEDVSEGLFKKGSLGLGEWLGWIKTNKTDRAIVAVGRGMKGWNSGNLKSWG